MLVAGFDAALEPGLAADEPLEGLDLEVEEIRDLQRLRDLREGDAGRCAGVVRVRRSGNGRGGRGGAGDSQDASFRELRFSSGVRLDRALPSPRPRGPGTSGPAAATGHEHAVCCRARPATRARVHPTTTPRPAEPVTEVVERARATWTQAAQRRSLAAQNAAVETGRRFHHQGNHRDLRVTCLAHRVKPLRVGKWFSWRDDRRKSWPWTGHAVPRRPMTRPSRPPTLPASAHTAGPAPLLDTR